jgi:hypothetical protein
MADAGSLAIIVQVGDQLPITTTLDQFLSANTELVDPSTAADIASVIQSFPLAVFTSPQDARRPHFSVKRAPASEPGSDLPCVIPVAVPVADPVYLHHASPLRAAVLAIAPCYRQADAAASIDACIYGPGRLPRVLCRLGGAWFPLSLKEARDEARHLVVNDGGPTDPAGELARHVAAALTAAADVLEAAMAAEQQAVLTAGRAA